MRIVNLLLVEIAVLVRHGAGQGAAYRPEQLCQWLHRLVKKLLMGHCTWVDWKSEQSENLLTKTSTIQHTDREPEPAAADLRGAVRQDVRGPPGRVLLLWAAGLRRHRGEETRAQAGHGWTVCACTTRGQVEESYNNFAYKQL